MDMQVTAHRFTIGRALKDTLAIFGRNVIVFMGSALLARFILVVAPTYQMQTSGAVIDLPLYLIRTAMDIAVSSLILAVVTFGTFSSLRGGKATVQDAISGLRFVPLILVGEAILTAPDVAGTVLSAQFPADSLLADFVGFALGIVTLALYLMWWLFAVTMMIEGRPLFSAMTRSNQLNRGQRWRVFAALLIVGLGAGVIIWVTALALGVPMIELPSAPMLTSAGMVVFVVYGLVATFYSVMATVAYYHLRLEKEGPFADDAVAVFD
jgi:hypothetical protein